MPLVVQNLKPRIILGLMTFGPDESNGARVTSLDEFNKCLDYFQENGYNEVDTARIYIGGTQEKFTTQAKWKERGLTLATKVYPKIPGTHKPDALREHFEQSLKELETDRVDIFYLHAPDRSVPFTETLEAVNKLHEEGKFVQFGLSNYTAFEVAEIVSVCNERGWVRPTVYQAMYNAISKLAPAFTQLPVQTVIAALANKSRPTKARSIETELLPACRRYGIDVVTYNPLAGGLFSGKYKTKDVPAEGRYSDVSRSGKLYRDRYFKDSTFDALRIIEPVVQKHGLTLIETALRWVRHHSALNLKEGGRDGIIIGVSSFSQLQGNLRDVEKGPLPDEVVQALDQAWLVTKATTPNYWHLDLNYAYNTHEALFKPKTKA